ncbi:MAG: M48 family metalloprotease [Rhizobiaceae bacterium]|nr:M48 family metalloprotease [Rhizobiaceae bacterium]
MNERLYHSHCLGGEASSSVRRKLAGIVLATLTLVGCVDPNSGLNEKTSLTSSWVRPEDPQESIGKKEHPLVVARYGGVYSNPKAEKLIAVVIGKLVSVSEDPSRVFKVTLLDSPKVNAFALPGGYLYVTRGLLALANDSSEVAAVLAHEMAHVSANHAIVRKEQLEGAAIGERVANQVLGGNTAGQFAVAANKLRLAAFSQDQELQADTIGIRMIGRAGYDPYAAERFLRTMDAYRAFLSGDKSFDDTENFASSHPSTPKRVELARRHARFFGAPGIGERGAERYYAGIDGMMFGDTPEEGFVRGRTFSHAGLGVTFKAPSGFRIDNQSKAVLVSGPNDIATRFDATVVSKRTSLTEYLQSGWITGLVEETIREETLNDLKTASATARGDGWRFKVRVVRDDSQVFRFITAAPQTNTNLDAVSRQITGSFRTLSEREVAQLKPLRVKVVQAQAGDTQTRIASRMQGTNKQLALFRLINGLSSDDVVQPGMRVKIVTSR